MTLAGIYISAQLNIIFPFSLLGNIDIICDKCSIGEIWQILQQHDKQSEEIQHKMALRLMAVFTFVQAINQI